MPGRLRENGISGCLSFLTARSAEAENRQIFQDSGKYFLEHHFPQSVPVTRGQGQSPALEGDAQANFRVTPHLPRGGRFRKSGRLDPALRYFLPERDVLENLPLSRVGGRGGWKEVACRLGMLSFARQLPARDGGTQGVFKASAFSKASASWERGSDAEVCVRTTL